MRNLEWRNLVLTNFGANSEMPLQTLVQIPGFIDREWWLLLPMRLWWVAVMSCSFWTVASMVALISEGPLGTIQIRTPRELKAAPRRMASDLQIPRHNLTHFCCAEFCHSKFSPLPHFPLPRYVCPGGCVSIDVCVCVRHQ